MKLLFQPSRIPRTTTREQWREIHRWRRMTEKTLSAYEARMVEQLRTAQSDLLFFGRTDITQDMLNRIINPPIILYPSQKPTP